MILGETGLEETPMFEKYEKDSVEGTQDEIRYLSTDFYLNTSIVLPQVDRLSWGKVVRHKRDVYGNPVVQENQNPIIDTRQYEDSLPMAR